MGGAAGAWGWGYWWGVYRGADKKGVTTAMGG